MFQQKLFDPLIPKLKLIPKYLHYSFLISLAYQLNSLAGVPLSSARKLWITTWNLPGFCLNKIQRASKNFTGHKEYSSQPHSPRVKEGKRKNCKWECVWERMVGWGARWRERGRLGREGGREEGTKLPIKFIVRKVILQTRSCLFHIKKPKYPQFGVLPKAKQLGNPEDNEALLPDTSASCGGICSGWRKRQIKENDFHP